MFFQKIKHLQEFLLDFTLNTKPRTLHIGKTEFAQIPEFDMTVIP